MVWDKVGSMFKKKLETERITEKGIEGEGEEMMLKVKRALKETEKEKRGKGGWWDKE